MWRDNPIAYRPAGLYPARTCRVSMLGGGALPVVLPAQASGGYWMGKGLRPPLKGAFTGAAFVFDAVR